MKIRRASSTVLVLWTVSTTAWAGPCYDVEVLWGQTCGIFGPAGVFPADISADGTIVGAVEQCADPALDEGFVWPVEGDPSVIPRPVGVAYLTANCINGRGQIGVHMSTSSGGHIYDLVSGSFTPIGVPPGGTSSKPYGITSQAQTCGEWGNSLTGPNIQAFTDTDRGLLDLGSVLIGPNSIARDINDRGSVIGFMGGTVGPTHRGFLYRDGQVIDFGIAPGCINSTARAINERDEVAAGGAAPTPDGNYARPFLWVEGRWTSIDMLPGFQACQTTDLNDHTIVVGACGSPGEGGYVWVDGVIYDLNDRIPPDSDVEIGFALAINNAGQIACEGTTQHPFFGFSRVGVRLTPRPPQPADLTDDCTVNGEDLTILLQSWGPILPSPSGRGAGGEGDRPRARPANPAADLDDNGIVNGFDLAILLGAWG